MKDKKSKNPAGQHANDRTNESDIRQGVDKFNAVIFSERIKLPSGLLGVVVDTPNTGWLCVLGTSIGVVDRVRKGDVVNVRRYQGKIVMYGLGRRAPLSELQ